MKLHKFAFGYPTSMTKAGSFNIQESADWLYSKLQDQDILQYQRVVFVAHSMGGLVTLRTLLMHKDLIPKEPLIVFFATPQEGAQITTLARRLIDNEALNEMLPVNDNSYLQLMDAEWRSIEPAQRPHIACAYEKIPIGGVTIVPYASATRYCDEAHAISANHLDIVKPVDRTDGEAYIILSNALRNFVLVERSDKDAQQGRLSAPDFAIKDGQALLTISDPRGKREVHVGNDGPGRMRYVLEQFPDNGLIAVPGIGPRFVDEGVTDVFQLVVGYEPQKTDYRFVLNSTGAPPLPVTVHIENLAAVQAFQADLVSSVFDSLLAAAKQPNKLVDSVSIVTATSEVIAGKYNEPDIGNQFLLTAKFMASVRWPGEAFLALRQAERSRPQIATDQGVQMFAAYAAYLAGKPDVLAGVPSDPQTVLASLRPGLPSPTPNRFMYVSQVGDKADELATLFKKEPALYALGNNLEGDSEFAKGNYAAAANAYETAFRLQSTPSLAENLARAQLGLNKPNEAAATLDLNARKFPGFYSKRMTEVFREGGVAVTK